MRPVIFDFNGTLFQDSEIHLMIWQKLYDQLFPNGVPYSEIYEKVKGLYNKITIDFYYELNGQDKPSPSDNLNLSLLKEKMYRDYCRDNHLCILTDGAAELLDYLKSKNTKINLASASIKENVDFFFTDFGLGRWFDQKLVAYDDGILKGKREMYEKACWNIDVSLKEAIAIEDSLIGYNSAVEAGINKIIMIDPKHKISKEEYMAAVVEDFTKIDRTIFEK